MVPGEIINRKRKAYISRAPLKIISNQCDRLIGISGNLVTESLGWVHGANLAEALRKVQEAKEVPIISMMRTLGLEFWLRGLIERGAGLECRPGSASISFQDVSAAEAELVSV
jgi:hypothetical protein